MTLADIKREYGLTETEAQKVEILTELLGDDTDGVWSLCQDEGIFIEYKDLAAYRDTVL